ncbi:MAG: MerR family transcriptional regulator [Nocardioides sp.]|jgi:DNA-binding transcriptional MerR regulator
MHIGEIAARTELSLRTLRHYDEIGLLRPSGRSDGGFRLYTQDDLDQLLLIRRMKPLGFSLEQMADVLRVIAILSAEPQPPGTPGDLDHARQRLREVLALARERRARLHRQLGMADEFIGLLDERLPASDG